MPRKKRQEPLVHQMNRFPGIEPRFDHRGQEYRSFLVYDPATKKTKRLTKEEVPGDIAYGNDEGCDDRAKKFLKLKLAEADSIKFKLQERLEWQNKFYDFKEILELYKKDIPNYSPRNVANNVYYVEQFILPFFLSVKQTNNMNNWPAFYQEFIDWLGVAKPAKVGYGERYSISTQNHVISALNTMMKIMKKRGKIRAFEKCDKHPSHLLNKRGPESVLRAGEILDIGEALKSIDTDSYELFVALKDGGFRISEGLGLSANDVCEDLPEKDESEAGQVVRWIESYGLKTYGYIQLCSQVDDYNKVRLSNNKVARVPLKGRKTMNLEDGRMVPVFTKEFAEIIDRRIKQIEKQWDCGQYGSDPSDYLLFDGVSYQRFSRALEQAYVQVAELKKKRYKPKSAHCLRHTCSTNLAGKTLGTNQVCRLVLGHKDDETTERYVHIFKSILQESQKVFQPKKRFAK